MMTQLSKINLPQIARAKISTDTFNLPEKVLQFGTGVLLRGLCDYFISKANDEGKFNGRIVVVKSTSQGDGQAFEKQDNLYTLCIRGLENGNETQVNYICSAISRVLHAGEEWNSILECAANRDMQVVISNTTEVGISFVPESIFQEPPVSFPAKLLAFLYERYTRFNGEGGTGMVIIPTELISNNGKQLQDILNKLAVHNKLDESFIKWLNEENSFCNSLVDRIVAGKPNAEKYMQLQEELGYTDELLAVCEPYRLWAIEGDEQVKKVLSFHEADNGIVIAPNIESFKALKLHLLNGTHSLTCGLAYLSGFDLVKNGMADSALFSFVSAVMQQEIAAAIPYQLDKKEIEAFALKVLDRFRNPFIDHLWLNITMQYSAKMRMRNVPVLLNYHKLYNKPPRYIAFGFAAYLLFMKVVESADNKYYGQRGEDFYPVNDDKAAYFFTTWSESADAKTLVATILKNQELWGTDLTSITGFQDEVTHHLENMLGKGIKASLKTFIA